MYCIDFVSFIQNMLLIYANIHKNVVCYIFVECYGLSDAFVFEDGPCPANLNFKLL